MSPLGELETTPRSCYVHLPFCDRICPYCDFAVVEFRQTQVDRYLDALRTELAQTPSPAPLRTMYLGGGTPSALREDQLTRLLAGLFEHFHVEPGSIECTLEANPSRSVADLARYGDAGVTRLSIGVQSFDADELKRLGRDHTAEEAEAFVRAARAAGHRNISIDLIAGSPGQTPGTFARTLERAIACGPDHISVYGLTIEPGTPYATWHARTPAAFPDDDAVADLLELADARLAAEGYRHYEISNFARPGFESEHNRGYWEQRPCIALGMSACGYENGVRYRNARSLEDYCAALEAGRSPRIEEERLDFESRVGEAAMLALRTAEGMRDEDFRARFGVDIRSVFAAPINKCREAGLLEAYGQGVRLTPRGRLLANTACSEFLHPSFSPAPAGLGTTAT